MTIASTIHPCTAVAASFNTTEITVTIGASGLQAGNSIGIVCGSETDGLLQAVGLHDKGA